MKNLFTPNKKSFNGIKSIIISSPKNNIKQYILTRNSKDKEKSSINKLQKNSFSNVNYFFIF
jgi:hypothetical protein